MAVVTSIAFEGLLDEALARRLCKETNLLVDGSFPCRGKGDLDKRLSGFNEAAKFGDWFVLRDFDGEEECPVALYKRLLDKPSARMHLRIVPHEIESWLLGDRDALAHFLGVSSARIPSDAEGIYDPKSVLIGLAQKSRFRHIRDDLVPAPRSTAKEGPAYTARMIGYVQEIWSPARAAENCPSLRRCMDRLLSA